MCEIAIGTDTGGSTRIPAALCGIVGFKPGQHRIPREGVFPLSYTLDSVGPLARTVADCAAADTVMVGEEPEPLAPAALDQLRIGIAAGFPIQGLEAAVQQAFSMATDILARSGAHLSEVTFPEFDRMMAINQKGGFASAEAYAIHRHRLERHGESYDPNVRARIERGRALSAADYIEMTQERNRLVREMNERMEDFDALAMPTTAIVAPKMAEVETRENFAEKNMALLRNPALVNFFDLCAISLPISGLPLPVGLMLVARNGHDRRLFRIAAAVEQRLAA
jgi:aspartyl-tRNA(Asn)/glutamyl-tRNA(Gln) amidotransferase subunit A